MIKKLILIFIFIAYSVFSALGQNIGYIDITNGNDTASGNSWATAWKTLTNAIVKTAGKPTNTFYLAQGTYYTPTKAGTDIVTNNLYGGYKNDGSGTRDWMIYPTIFCGGLTNRVLQKLSGGTSILDGLNIVNGTNSGTSLQKNGGGLNCTSGNLIVNNCLFTNNVISGNGAAVCHSSTGASNVFSNCTFRGNIIYGTDNSQANGGAVCFIRASTNSFVGCTFVTNFLQGMSYTPIGFGGAVAENVYEGRLAFTSCTFSNNVAKAFKTGGSDIGGHGAAIYSMGTLDLSGGNNLFSGNVSYGDGGAIYHNSSVTNTVQINNSTFNANIGGSVSAGTKGGAIVFNLACTSMVQNCAFINNSFLGGNPSGGAIYYTGAGFATLMNCTFFTNAVVGSGQGGAVMAGTAGSTLNVTNCIFWGNKSSSSGTNIQLAGTMTIGYSDINTNAGWVSGGVVVDGGGIINLDPLFASQTAPYDLHVKSIQGRYDANISMWVYDTVNSPTLDAGCPRCPYFLEPIPNGGRINLGRYGNTVEASKSGSYSQNSVPNIFNDIYLKNDIVTEF
jgi:hypothetical protein